MSNSSVAKVEKKAKGKSLKQIEEVIKSFKKDINPKIKHEWEKALKEKKKDQCIIISVSKDKLESADDLVVKKYKALQNSAKQRGKDFNLSLSDVRKLIDRKTCAYTGMRLTYDGGHCPSKATIDRFDPQLGYVKGNVFTVCHSANALKEHLFESGGCRGMSIKQLQKFCKVMTEMGLEGVVG